MTTPGRGKVYLVGAGPGDPGLLTLRGVECLHAADLVIYDKLVPMRVLTHAGVTAESHCVNDLGRNVTEVMIEAALSGRTVVRLKGGDPLIFGRGGEEVQALREAGVAYEIVPGITAGLAAAAMSEIPLTHRAHASAVALITGHEDPGKPNSALDWAALAKFPGTLVVYMGFARLERIVEVLLEHGKSAATPCCAVSAATTGHQITVSTTLAELPDVVRNAGVSAPVVIFVGPVVALRPARSWFDSRPLHGVRVLIPRPKQQAGPQTRRLELLGAVPYCLPALDIGPPASWEDVDERIAHLSRYDWVVFTSPNGVRGLLNRLMETGRDVRAFASCRIAAIGPGTANVLRGYCLNADLIPPEYRAESLAESLRPLVRGRSLLFARGDRGRDVLIEQLSGIAAIDAVTVYRQHDAIDPDSPVFDAIRRGEVDAVLLTSSNIARALLNSFDSICVNRVRSGWVKLFSISPVTSRTIRELGLGVTDEATVYTPDGLIDRLTEWYRANGV